MNYNQENFIISEVFTEKEIDSIYESAASLQEEATYTVRKYGQKAFFGKFNESITNKLLNIAEEISGKKLVLKDITFARYSLEWGMPVKLFPHYDEIFQDPVLTIDVQINSTKPWALVVEGEKFTLKNNEALVFSATHQVHWREKIKFEEDDFIDMLFCFFIEDSDNKPKLDQEYRKKMINQQKYWSVKYSE